MRTLSESAPSAERPPGGRRIPGWIFTLLLLLGSVVSGLLHAEDPAASASLTRDVVGMGQPVQFHLEVTGSTRVTQPPDLNVDGLDIRYLGPQQLMQLNGTRVSMRVTHVYQVLPRRTGTFTIPGVQIEVDGRKLQTQPVTLRVQQGATNGGGAQDADELDQLAWAEVVLPRQTAYVGETLPVELRIYVDTRIRWRLEAMPTFEGEGFTKTKLTEPQSDQTRKNGRDYSVLVVRTAITPSKAGKIAIGPAEFVFNAMIPRQRNNRSRSMFDQFFGEDFPDPFNTFARTEQRKATAKAVELDVKPLPAAGRPANFSGAVGQFEMSADGSPKAVKVGDPVTMTLRVTGRGNFDRAGAPSLRDSTGWRTYPPSSNFRADDDVGISGTKTFEVAVIPEVKKTEMPVFEFCYFDPISEKYETLNSGHMPLKVEGEAVPPPPPVATHSSDLADERPESAPAPAPAPKPTDIIGIRYDPGAHGTFAPLYARNDFWWFQALPLSVFGGLAVMRLRKPNLAASRVAELRRQRSALLSKLRRAGDRTEFYDTAVRVLQIDAALATGRLPESVDAAVVRQLREERGEPVDWVNKLFDNRAEALYAGGRPASGSVPEDFRRQVLSSLENHRA